MSTEQINIRLDADLVGALERVAREEALDRATAIRRLLETSIKQWELERAILGYRRGELSLGRAADEAGLTQWELIDATRAAGIAYPLTAEQAEERIALLGDGADTLPDIPPRPGGVLMVGINPAPVSVAAGHYYQGRLGRRLWRRLESLGLLRDPVPGAEDAAFAGAGHGLTDLVKRPTRSSAELSDDELRAGVDALRAKVREWRPGLIVFPFKEAASRLIGRSVSPGPGPPFEGVPTFLLSGPYAAKAEAQRVDNELQRELAPAAAERGGGSQRSQRVTATDLERGQIRFPRPAKRFFPVVKGAVNIVLRGERLTGTFDPRRGSDRERSAVLRIDPKALRRLVSLDEVLRVSRGLGGTVLLD